MFPYRVYFLDRKDHIRRAVNLDCAGDADAMAMAERLADLQPIELWHGARRLGRYEPLAQSA